MKLGYARVSTDDQITRLQRDALKGAGCERIYDETASSAKENRPELIRMLDHARAGDVVIVWKLDRPVPSFPVGLASPHMTISPTLDCSYST